MARDNLLHRHHSGSTVRAARSSSTSSATTSLTAPQGGDFKIPAINIDDPDALFAVDVYRDGADEPYSTGFTTRQEAKEEVDRLGPQGNFDRLELYAWIDDQNEWGEPLEEWTPGEF